MIQAVLGRRVFVFYAVFCAAFCLFLFAGGSPVMAQTPPCSTAGHAGNSYETCASGTCERMVCNGSTYVASSAWSTQGHSSIKFGNDTSACNSSRAGRMRYNPPANWEYCNGTNWAPFSLIGELSNLSCWGEEWYVKQTQAPVRYAQLSGSQSVLYGILPNGPLVHVGGTYPSYSDPDYLQKFAPGFHFYGCALLTDGSAKCYNGGDMIQVLTSWTSAFGTNVVDIDTSLREPWSSRGHTCAVLSNGDMDCTSSLGDGDGGVATDRPGIGAVRVAVGEDHTCVLKGDGSVECWNISGTPAVTDAVQIVAGGREESGNRASCLLRSTGAVNCWGDGPVVSGVGSAPSDAVKIAMAQQGSSACAIRAGGTVACWGDVATVNNGRKERTLATANVTNAIDIAVFHRSGCAAVAE